jgi:hypothetical protein
MSQTAVEKRVWNRSSVTVSDNSCSSSGRTSSELKHTNDSFKRPAFPFIYIKVAAACYNSDATNSFQSIRELQVLKYCSLTFYSVCLSSLRKIFGVSFRNHRSRRNFSLCTVPNVLFARSGIGDCAQAPFIYRPLKIARLLLHEVPLRICAFPLVLHH